MKRFILSACTAVFALSSCEKLKESLGKAKEESAEGAEAGEGGSATAKVLAESEFESFIATRNQVMVVDFHATWCGPCKTLAPKLSKVVGEFGQKAALGKIDVDQANALAARLGVSSIPDVRIFVGGREVDRFVGDLSESQIREKIKVHADAVTGVPEMGPPGESDDPAGKAGPVIQPMKKDWIPPGMERQ